MAEQLLHQAQGIVGGQLGSPGGDLISYQDNLEQERTYHYDELHRLDLITYADTTTVALAYDKVGNLVSTLERDGKGWTYQYDALNRLVSQQYTDQTILGSEYNATGQRMVLGDHGNRYATSAQFGSARFGVEPIWQVPENGRDAMGRLLRVQDADGGETAMLYNVDGRCRQIDHDNSLSDMMAFDIVGKLLSPPSQNAPCLNELHPSWTDSPSVDQQD